MDGQFFLAKPGVNLSEDGDRPCMLWFTSNLCSRIVRAEQKAAIARTESSFVARDHRLEPSFGIIKAEVDVLKILPR